MDAARDSSVGHLTAEDAVVSFGSWYISKTELEGE